MAERTLTAVQTSGGRGTRSRPLSLYSPTSMIPKGLMRVMGVPIAEIQLEEFKAAGIKGVYMITQYLENREHISSRFSDGRHRFGIDIHYSRPSDDERNNGSGDAILTNIERYALGGDSIWLANDNLYEFDHNKATQFHRDLGAVVSILAVRMSPRDTIRTYGMVDADSNRLVRKLLEKPRNDAEIMGALKIENPGELDSMRVFVNTGGYVLNNDALRTISDERWVVDGRKKSNGEFDMAGQLIRGLIHHNHPVYVFSIDAWGDFGSTPFFLDTFPQALGGLFPSIHKILETRKYYHSASDNLWIHPDSLNLKNAEGKTLDERMKSGRVKIGPNVFIGRNVQIADGAEIGYSDLEKDVEVGESFLHRVYLSPYCIVGSHAHLEDCALGLAVKVDSSKQSPAYINGRSIIGPSIKIPEGTRLDDTTIFPGYLFKGPGETHSRSILKPSHKEIARIVQQYT